MNRTYKLPAVVVREHRALLDGWDFVRKPAMNLVDALPEAGFREGDVLEAIGRGGGLVIRSRAASTANRMRRYAQTLETKP